ncbi:hypothetical protein OA410_04800 [Paracoccaceae bacterium]|nr:hypothetical protein [Paracoccaceae bacterium]
MNYNSKNLIENTGLKLDQKSIGSLQKEIQLLSCSDVHEIAHLFTNPESYFFRSFSHLELVKKMSTEKTSIWFAGCSTGQEIYSAALMLSSIRDKKLLGTDLSRKYIEKAISGSFFVFKKSEIKALEKYKNVSQSYLHLNNNKKSLDVKFSSIKKHFYNRLYQIRYCRDHLMDGPYSSGFDIVYCRNVLLHMTIKGKKKALNSLKDGVKAGGILILGDTDPHIFEDNWERNKYKNAIFWKKKW